MVTQKGINGITPYEKITYSHKNNWADVLDEKLCVPFKSKRIINDHTLDARLIFFLFTVIGNPIVLDDVTNTQRTFCNTSLLWADEYAEYCNTSKLLVTGVVHPDL